jgi:hypothetical protein
MAEEATAAPAKKKAPVRRRRPAKRAPKAMDTAVRDATSRTAGAFVAEMMSAGANVTRMKKLEEKRHGLTGFAEFPDGDRVTLTITSKGKP